VFLPAQRASEWIVRDCALRGIVFHPTSQTGKRLPDAGCFRLCISHSASIRRTARANALSRKGTALQGDLSLGRTTSRTSIPCLRSLGRPAKLISELDSSVVEREAYASIVSAPKQSFADRSPIYDDLQRRYQQQHASSPLYELVNVRARSTFHCRSQQHQLIMQ